jgi:hypothetical protein
MINLLSTIFYRYSMGIDWYNNRFLRHRPARHIDLPVKGLRARMEAGNSPRGLKNMKIRIVGNEQTKIFLDFRF